MYVTPFMECALNYTDGTESIKHLKFNIQYHLSLMCVDHRAGGRVLGFGMTFVLGFVAVRVTPTGLAASLLAFFATGMSVSLQTLVAAAFSSSLSDEEELESVHDVMSS